MKTQSSCLEIPRSRFKKAIKLKRLVWITEGYPPVYSYDKTMISAEDKVKLYF